MSRHAQRAAFNLLCTLPVRTIPAKPQAPKPTPGGHHPQAIEKLEREILELDAKGIPNSEIAAILGVSKSTAYRYRKKPTGAA